jgi:hypothetical protein
LFFSSRNQHLSRFKRLEEKEQKEKKGNCNMKNVRMGKETVKVRKSEYMQKAEV